MKKPELSGVLLVIGLALIALGLFLVKTVDDPQRFWRALPYLCIGVGCGAFGHAVGNIVSRRAIKNHPALGRSIEIEKNDERNIAITNHAKAKAFDLMTYIFGALLLTFALMGIDVAAVLLLVFAYLFVQGYALYHSCRYHKEI